MASRVAGLHGMWQAVARHCRFNASAQRVRAHVAESDGRLAGDSLGTIESSQRALPTNRLPITNLRSMRDPADEALAERSTVARGHVLVNSSVRCSGVSSERISRAFNVAAGGCAPALSNLPSISRNVTAQISGAEKA